METGRDRQTDKDNIKGCLSIIWIKENLNLIKFSIFIYLLPHKQTLHMCFIDKMHFTNLYPKLHLIPALT